MEGRALRRVRLGLPRAHNCVHVREAHGVRLEGSLHGAVNVVRHTGSPGVHPTARLSMGRKVKEEAWILGKQWR